MSQRLPTQPVTRAARRLPTPAPARFAPARFAPARFAPFALLALFALLLAPASAWAQGGKAAKPLPPPADLPAATSPFYGTVVVLKDRRAGLFEDVRRRSREVTLVRAGIEVPLQVGLEVHEGDAIRAALGTCVVRTEAGWQVEIGERSQVRLGKSVLQRLGEVFYSVKGAFTVEIGEVDLLVEGTAFKVTSTIPGDGAVALTEGRVQATGAGNEQALQAPTTTTFTQAAGPAEPRILTAVELEAIAAWRAARFTPPPPAGSTGSSPSERDRLQLRLEGGVSVLDTAGWGRGGVEVRVRPVGPLWIVGGASIAGRAADELANAPTLLTLPAHLGARVMASMPPTFFLGGGADFTLMVGGRCDNTVVCNRVTAAEPGVRGAVTAGLFLSRRVGIDIEISGGIMQRTFPAPVGQTELVRVVDGQFHTAVGVFVRL